MLALGKKCSNPNSVVANTEDLKRSSLTTDNLKIQL